MEKNPNCGRVRGSSKVQLNVIKILGCNGTVMANKLVEEIWFCLKDPPPPYLFLLGITVIVSENVLKFLLWHFA